MKKKKSLIFPLVAALCLASFTACGQAAPDETNISTSISTYTISDEATESDTKAPKNGNSETESVEVQDTVERNDEMRDITPKELVAEIKAGWNLGNTFDALGSGTLSDETCWGNPKTTKEMIDAVNEKGFNSIRIPVTWARHMGEAPDYTIDSEWMKRVEEVVNYALDDGMYVIINSHHEEEWRIPDYEHIDAVDEQNKALWTQVANHFKDYGDHLIFEGLNEPRVKGGEKEWEGGTPEGRECLDRLNQSFVDAVRATGGNNEKRLVLITSFASSHVIPTIGCLAIPEDDHLAVSIHAYTPYAFTYASGESWELFDWDGSHNNEIDSVFNDLQRIFLDKGIPVLLTEYGAVNKNGNDNDVNAWAEAYVSRATKKGMPCYWWDNGIYDGSGECFAIFDRKNLTWYREDVANTIINESNK